MENYKQSRINVGKVDIGAVCYNFMPAVDWICTNLGYVLEHTDSAFRFDRFCSV
ncbi:mannonate dehydratase [Psychrobacter sp. P11G3]|uniref:mannonate dehydratase n=1 Tax=Psychrobacter sp. P11G3 TaxID=1699623 RepID=UPI0039B6FB40